LEFIQRSIRWHNIESAGTGNCRRGALYVARGVQRVLQRYKDLQDIIAILGMDELSPEDKINCSSRTQDQRFLSQPFHVAEVFTGFKGQYVPVPEQSAVSKKFSMANTTMCPSKTST